jgi:hypothetical protein
MTTKCICYHCGDLVDLSEEGVTYSDGRAAHEACDDACEFDRANAGDFRD